LARTSDRYKSPGEVVFDHDRQSRSGCGVGRFNLTYAAVRIGEASIGGATRRHVATAQAASSWFGALEDERVLNADISAFGVSVKRVSRTSL